MTNDSQPPFILPDSVFPRRRGLLEAAPEAPPRQWAEHLELLTADSKLTSVDDMLGLMQKELDRLQEQINPDDEPDRHSETVLAAATASFLDSKASPEQRSNHREVYFSILLGYLYGRLTKPGEKAMSESAAVHIRDYQAQMKRQQGGKSSAERKRAEKALRMAEARRMWEELLASGRPERGVASLVAQRMNVTAKTIRVWRKAGWSNETNE